MIQSKVINLTGMKCAGCETVIEDAIKKTGNIHAVKADFRKSIVYVRFDPEIISLTGIEEICSGCGYNIVLKNVTEKHKYYKNALSVFALTTLLLVVMFAGKYGHMQVLNEIGNRAGYSMIFITGLFTGLHCVGMCGSFVVGFTSTDSEQCRPVFHSHIMYGAGKTLSYALFGAFFGFIGSLFRITPFISGISIIIAGVFLILYGMNMLNIFSFLKFIIIKQPDCVRDFVAEKRNRSKSPFFIGIFSGLILGCGPLQVMYVMAAGNGSPVEGALFLTVFGLGTLPALIGFGLLARMMSNTLTQRFLRATGIILIIFGSVMLNRGFAKAGLDNNVKTDTPKCHSQH